VALDTTIPSVLNKEVNDPQIIAVNMSNDESYLTERNMSVSPHSEHQFCRVRNLAARETVARPPLCGTIVNFWKVAVIFTVTQNDRHPTIASSF
jgi:hypothetical protein